MDIEKIIRTFLQKNPAIPAKFLIPKLREKTGLSRSTIYKHLRSLDNRGLIYSEKGRYWIEKPASQESGTRLKHPQKREQKEEIDLEIRRLQCKMEIGRMIRKYYKECDLAYRTDPQKYNARNEPVPFDVKADIEKKCRKKYGLSTKDPL